MLKQGSFRTAFCSVLHIYVYTHTHIHTFLDWFPVLACPSISSKDRFASFRGKVQGLDKPKAKPGKLKRMPTKELKVAAHVYDLLVLGWAERPAVGPLLWFRKGMTHCCGRFTYGSFPHSFPIAPAERVHRSVHVVHVVHVRRLVVRREARGRRVSRRPWRRRAAASAWASSSPRRERSRN